MKRLLTISFVLVLMIAGCVGSPGSGGAGGQGIAIHAEYGSNIEHVHIWITDGGTDAALRYKSDGNTPTTQPAE